jgi:hypothetical protein
MGCKRNRRSFEGFRLPAANTVNESAYQRDIRISHTTGGGGDRSRLQEAAEAEQKHKQAAANAFPNKQS